MRQADTLGIAGRRIGIELEFVARNELGAALRECADPQFRALEICQYADRPIELGLHGAQRRNALTHRIARQMAHIEAKHVDASPEQLRRDRGVFGGRTEGGDNLDPAQAPHLETAPCWPVFWSVSCTRQSFCSPVSTSKNPVRS